MTQAIHHSRSASGPPALVPTAVSVADRVATLSAAYFANPSEHMHEILDRT